MEKTCLSCHISKPLAEFHVDRSRKDALAVYCKPCMSAKVKDYSKRALRHKSPDGMRYCGVCKETKPIGDFYAAKGNVDGLAKRCKSCSKITLQIWRAKYPERHRETTRRWGKRNPEKKKDVNLKTKYGLPYGSYDRMLAAQEGGCAICRTTTPPGKAGRFHVDHDHETGVVRGLLCTNCNWGIGQFKHREALLQEAIKYLQAYPKVPLKAEVDSMRMKN